MTKRAGKFTESGPFVGSGGQEHYNFSAQVGTLQRKKATRFYHDCNNSAMTTL